MTPQDTLDTTTALMGGSMFALLGLVGFAAYRGREGGETIDAIALDAIALDAIALDAIALDAATVRPPPLVDPNFQRNIHGLTFAEWQVLAHIAPVARVGEGSPNEQFWHNGALPEHMGYRTASSMQENGRGLTFRQWLKIGYFPREAFTTANGMLTGNGRENIEVAWQRAEDPIAYHRYVFEHFRTGAPPPAYTATPLTPRTPAPAPPPPPPPPPLLPRGLPAQAWPVPRYSRAAEPPPVTKRTPTLTSAETREAAPAAHGLADRTHAAKPADKLSAKPVASHAVKPAASPEQEAFIAWQRRAGFAPPFLLVGQGGEYERLWRVGVIPEAVAERRRLRGKR